MKNEYGKQVKLGAFVLGGLLLFIVAVYMIGQQQKLFSKTFRLHCFFNNVSGLREGNNVRYSGIVIGTVKQIGLLSDTTVLVTMELEKDVQRFIRQDAMASIGSDGLMGNRVINIVPGNENTQHVQIDDTLMSIKPVETDQIIRSLKMTVDNAVSITENLDQIMAKINRGTGTVGELLNSNEIAQSLRQTLQQARAVTSQVKSVTSKAELFVDDIDTITQNAKTASVSLNENMEALKENFLFRRYYKNKQKQEEKRLKAIQEEEKKARKQEAKRLREEARKLR